MVRLTTHLFFDFEFTGLHKDTTPISLGITTSSGKHFYAEFTDFAKDQVDDWIRDNVIKHLQFKDDEAPMKKDIGAFTFVKGCRLHVGAALQEWIKQFSHVEFIGDCLWYDAVLMNELLGGALNLPKNVDYIFKDIATMFSVYGIDPDISRAHFIDRPVEGTKHHALYDAWEIQACYEKMSNNHSDYINMV